MSDTMQMVLWIILGLVVVALIVWLLISASRRRKAAAQRAEAAALRARVEERLPELQNAEDRASVTTEIAQEARAEAEEKAAEAARLERHAEKHRAEAEAAVQERESLEREADRLDPDVPTDDEGYRVDQSGHRLNAPEEPRFKERAPEERQAGEPQPEERRADERRLGQPRPEEGELEERGAFGRPGGAPGSVAAGVALAGSGMAAAAAGRTGGPQPFADEDDEPDLADAENPFAGQGEPEPVPGLATSAEEVPVAVEPEPATMAPDSTEDPDWVNSPVEDVDDEQLKASAAEEIAAEDWINGPTEDEATSTAAAGGNGTGAAVAGAGAAGTSPARTSDPREDDGMASDDADWVNDPVEDVEQEEIDASAAEESEAADWINGPDDDGPSVVHSDGGRDGATGARGEARREAVEAEAAGGEQVSVPALDDTDDVLAGGGTPEDDPGDHRGQPWSTDLAGDAGTRSDSATGTAQEPAAPAGHGEEPGEASHVVENPGPVEHSDRAPLLDDATGTDEGDQESSPSTDTTTTDTSEATDASEVADAPAPGAMAAAAPGSTAAAPSSGPVAERSQQPYSRDEPLDVEPIPEPSGSEVPPLDEPGPEEPGAADEREVTEEPAAPADGPARERRTSGFEEVRDGGYGMGSAAPLEDGAQPLGHAIKGYRGSSTFVAPGDPGYGDAEPDVWFFNEEAARRAGFNPASE